MIYDMLETRLRAFPHAPFFQYPLSSPSNTLRVLAR